MTRTRSVVGVLVLASLLAITVAYLRTRDEGGQALRPGRHAVHLVSVDAPDQRVTVEVASSPDDGDGETTELRVADDVEVSVVDRESATGTELVPIELADLPHYLDQRSDSTLAFWVDVRDDGRVGLIEEQP